MLQSGGDKFRYFFHKIREIGGENSFSYTAFPAGYRDDGYHTWASVDERGVKINQFCGFIDRSIYTYYTSCVIKVLLVHNVSATLDAVSRNMCLFFKDKDYQLRTKNAKNAETPDFC